MAFTEKMLPYSRLKHFQFFATDGDEAVAPDVEFVESMSPSYAYELGEIRLHLSTAHASVVDFMVTISNHMGSMYNQNILSQAMVGVQDVFLQLDPPIILHSADTIDFSLVMSAVNTYGLKVSGWAITVPARA
jgi:hypothetical protein